MRVLVADDEELMLIALKKILSKEEDITLQTAATGKEAIEKAEAFRPDLTIMDIKMPGIDGLEALSEIRRYNQSMVLVVLSAYDSFSYAQEAIRLNVFDYLVKPVTETKILEMVARVRRHFEEQRSSRREELDLREKYKRVIPIIEGEFLDALITGVDEVAFQEYLDILDLKLDSGFFMALSFIRDDLQETGDEREIRLLSREKLVALAETVKQYFSCLIDPAKTDPVIIFIPIEKDEEEAVKPLQDEEEAWRFAQKLLEVVGDKIKGSLKIGLGGIYSAPEKLRKSYYEALKALCHQSKDPIVRYSELQVETGAGWERKLFAIFEEIWDSVRYGYPAKLRNLLARLVTLSLGIDGREEDRLIFFLMELLFISYKLAADSSDDPFPFAPGFYRIEELFAAAKDLNKTLDVITGELLEMAMMVNDKRNNRIKDIVLKAQEIVDRDFCLQLTLQDLAVRVNVSSYYLSRLFGEELGMSFTEYLTKLRMEKALQLLAEGYLVKDCCYTVGYNDPNYFSRIFRRYYGLTPTEYRERYQG